MNKALSAEWLFIDSISDHAQYKFHELVLQGIVGDVSTGRRVVQEHDGDPGRLLVGDERLHPLQHRQ
ncbi:hypothetical protein V7S43_014257 [Phytophthora oleae]|uniref:Uncharacterized protein n=1 Tax=Phytophthora oleae TaxID=2107226 RepID=A0ABD3F202_9STRA